MNTPQGRTLLLTALALAAIGDALLQDAASGVNILLVMGAIIAAAWFLRQRLSTLVSVAGSAVLCLLASAGFALRDSPTLAALAGLTLATSAGWGIRQARTGQAARMGVLQILTAPLEIAREMLLGGVQLLRQKETWATASAGEGRPQIATALLHGGLLSVPLLLLFGTLLSSADPVFAHFVAATFDWDVSSVASRLLWVAAVTVAAGGVLSLLTAAPAPDVTTESTPPFSIGRVETGVMLGTVNILFAAFVLVQMRYFFGGQSAVQTMVGMTYATYARHGFFELVWVAGLCLPLLLTLHTGQMLDGQKSFRVLAGGMLALLFAIMASALARMNLYRSEYGLTELRLYTTAFMGWLAVVFAWFAATVLRGRREWFAVGAAGFAAAGVLALFVLNPDAAIVRANARLAQKGRAFDVCYAASLSADAVPELVSRLSSLPLPAQRVAAVRLWSRWGTPPPANGRSWCWSRWRAERAVQSHWALLSVLRAAAPIHPCASAEGDE